MANLSEHLLNEYFTLIQGSFHELRQHAIRVFT